MSHYHTTNCALREITLIEEPFQTYQLTRASAIVNGMKPEICIDVCRPGESDYLVYDDDYVFVHGDDSLLSIFIDVPRKELTQAHRDNLLFNISAECTKCQSSSYFSCSSCYPQLAQVERKVFHLRDLPRILELAREAGYLMIEENDEVTEETVFSTPQVISSY